MILFLPGGTERMTSGVRAGSSFATFFPAIPRKKSGYPLLMFYPNLLSFLIVKVCSRHLPLTCKIFGFYFLGLFPLYFH